MPSFGSTTLCTGDKLNSLQNPTIKFSLKPDDVLIRRWSDGKDGAQDTTVTGPLATTSNSLEEVKKIWAAVARHQGSDERVATRQLFQRLSLTLMRGNAALITPGNKYFRDGIQSKGSKLFSSLIGLFRMEETGTFCCEL